MGSGWRWDYIRDLLFLFAVVMHMLIDQARQESLWDMMLADSSVICIDSKKQVEEKTKTSEEVRGYTEGVHAECW